jgi:ATP phosphoribosyltransferase
MTAVTSPGSANGGADPGRRLLRVAVPNKGSLSESAAEMLREAGYRQRTDTRELVLCDEPNGIEFFFLRPRDIAVYVGEGTLDVGITGRDLLLDSGAHAEEVVQLGFGTSRFFFAARPGMLTSLTDLIGRRIASSYPQLVTRYLAERGIAARVVRLDGAVETAIQLGVADVIADVVSTGTTLRAAGLEIFGEPILYSEAVVIRRKGSAYGDDVAVLLRRLQGVLVAREYVMMDYDVPTSLVEKACVITPGLESPTVSELRRADWSAVRAMVPRAVTNQVMDDLYALGARAILVTQIHACRL